MSKEGRNNLIDRVRFIRWIGVSLVVLITSGVYAQTTSITQMLNYPEGTVLVAAHRGDILNYPENSISAIESCIRRGIDIVEIDVQMTKDHQLILMHDVTINRTTNGKGKVGKHTLKKLKMHKLRGPGGRIWDERVPTLEEAIRTARGRIILNLDKSSRFLDQILVMLDTMDARQTVIFKGVFGYEFLRRKIEENPQGPLMMPIMYYKKRADLDTFLTKGQPRLAELILSNDTNNMVTPDGQALFRRNNCRIWYNAFYKSMSLGFSENENALMTWDSLIAHGAFIIQTDYPFELMQHLINIGRRQPPAGWQNVNLASLPFKIPVMLADTTQDTIAQVVPVVIKKATPPPVSKSHQKKVYHKIRQGDTLSHLAVKYKTTVSDICKLNKSLKPTTTLKLGRKIRVK